MMPVGRIAEHPDGVVGIHLGDAVGIETDDVGALGEIDDFEIFDIRAVFQNVEITRELDDVDAGAAVEFPVVIVVQDEHVVAGADSILSILVKTSWPVSGPSAVLSAAIPTRWNTSGCDASALGNASKSWSAPPS
jgi:hypothetical protein